jgi:hypothetical protein
VTRWVTRGGREHPFLVWRQGIGIAFAKAYRSGAVCFPEENRAQQDALPVISAAGPMDDLVQSNSEFAADYFFSSASQFVTGTTGVVLSMVEFTNKNQPWRVTS